MAISFFRRLTDALHDTNVIEVEYPGLSMSNNIARLSANKVAMLPIIGGNSYIHYKLLFLFISQFKLQIQMIFELEHIASCQYYLHY